MGFFGLLGALFGKKKKKTDPYADLLNSLSPYTNPAKDTMNAAFTGGQNDITSARSTANSQIDFWKTIESGHLDNIMKLLNTDDLTKQYDENIKTESQTGVRGGLAASTLAKAPFDKMSMVDNLIKEYKMKAPNELANLSQLLSSLGINEEQIGAGISGTGINTALNIQQLRDRRREATLQMIGAILGTAGSAAGAYLGGRGK